MGWPQSLVWNVEISSVKLTLMAVAVCLKKKQGLA